MDKPTASSASKSVRKNDPNHPLARPSIPPRASRPIASGHRPVKSFSSVESFNKGEVSASDENTKSTSLSRRSSTLGRVTPKSPVKSGLSSANPAVSRTPGLAARPSTSNLTPTRKRLSTATTSSTSTESKKDHKDTIQALEERLQKLSVSKELEKTSYEQTIEDLRREKQGIQETSKARVDGYLENIDSLHSNIRELRERRERELKEANESIRDLQQTKDSELKHQRELIDSLHSQIQKLQEVKQGEFNKAKAHFDQVQEATVAKLKSRHDEELKENKEELQRQHRTECDSIQKGLEADQVKLQQQHRDEHDVLQAGFQKEREQLQQQLQNERDSMQKTLQEQKVELQQQHQEERELMQKSFEDDRDKIEQEHKVKHDSLQESFEKERAALKQQHFSERDLMQKDFEKDRSELQVQHLNERDMMQKIFEKDRANVQDQHRIECSSMQKSFEEERAKSKEQDREAPTEREVLQLDQINDLKKQLGTVKANSRVLGDDLKQTRADLEAACEEIQQGRADLEAEIASSRLVEEAEEKRKQLQAALAAEHDSATSKLKAKVRDLEENQERSNVLIKEALQARSDADTASSRLVEEAEEERKQLQAALAAEHESATSKLKAKVRDLEENQQRSNALMKVAQSNVEKATAALQEERMKKSHNTSHPVSPAPQENSDTRSWARSWTSMADGNRNGTSSEETAVGEDEGLPIQIQMAQMQKQIQQMDILNEELLEEQQRQALSSSHVPQV
ncbi:MAG: hypothetical protein Q9190_004954 [Brigantiaea leucoxantha]